MFFIMDKNPLTSTNIIILQLKCISRLTINYKNILDKPPKDIYGLLMNNIQKEF